METQSAESSHQRCTDSGEKETCVMHRCAGVRLLFRSHRCFHEGTPDLGIVKLTQKFQLERGVGRWGPSHPCCPHGQQLQHTLTLTSLVSND